MKTFTNATQNRCCAWKICNILVVEVLKHFLGLLNSRLIPTRLLKWRLKAEKSFHDEIVLLVICKRKVSLYWNSNNEQIKIIIAKLYQQFRCWGSVQSLVDRKTDPWWDQFKQLTTCGPLFLKPAVSAVFTFTSCIFYFFVHCCCFMILENTAVFVTKRTCGWFWLF